MFIHDHLLFDFCSLRLENLLLRLLINSLSNQLALQPLLLIFETPPLLQHSFPMVFFLLQLVDLLLHFFDIVFTLSLPHQLKQLLIGLELHVGKHLILLSALHLVLRHPLFTIEFSFDSLLLFFS